MAKKTYAYKPGQDLIQAIADPMDTASKVAEDPEISEKLTDAISTFFSMMQSDIVDLISKMSKADYSGALDELISLSVTHYSLINYGRKILTKDGFKKSDWDELKSAASAIIDITKAWMHNEFLNLKKK